MTNIIQIDGRDVKLLGEFKRSVLGRWVDSEDGSTRTMFKCDKCGYQATSAAGAYRVPGDFSTHYAYCPECGPEFPVGRVEVPVQRWERGWVEVKCCRTWLQCWSFTNTCDKCGKDYNGSGHQLAPRALWGEETGETAADILNAEAAGFPEEGPHADPEVIPYPPRFS